METCFRQFQVLLYRWRRYQLALMTEPDAETGRKATDGRSVGTLSRARTVGWQFVRECDNQGKSETQYACRQLKNGKGDGDSSMGMGKK